MQNEKISVWYFSSGKETPKFFNSFYKNRTFIFSGFVNSVLLCQNFLFSKKFSLEF
ncbi:hypothetical protein LEP1GSC045_2795 [Leptospira interrogans serovar Pomona str. Kennewicki LC82-25]|uniref:Uncharacterized protein n=1 Tax=Leptospira interrogans str. UI 12621 TaxID=1049937 RepID=A0A0F6H5T4_LEPIR|nr:hypothetical protein LEP1GSC045_2795 [Leptospira interrogans serovar Pomona str. Kennewicki LC82-25]EJP01750.1 hypothetical protein LEP1GSC007_4016 [Leptospira interrogans serovar Bulgarica str. Mallika]EKO23583.1 hypothetical protein LEP1GSC104_4431 [Leptospira interrogans str. UI 12621]EKO69263.1 hypothetical protein LEP1GSC069_4442 [Leptospira interrogans serovar Canicola str. Fiocruz LV133]EKR83856.1 hypothetical protein LEP1GSC099_3437 [Leptospira interrogans str. UI 08452]EMF33091.1 h